MAVSFLENERRAISVRARSGPQLRPYVLFNDQSRLETSRLRKARLLDKIQPERGFHQFTDMFQKEVAAKQDQC